MPNYFLRSFEKKIEKIFGRSQVGGVAKVFLRLLISRGETSKKLEQLKKHKSLQGDRETKVRPTCSLSNEQKQQKGEVSNA